MRCFRKSSGIYILSSVKKCQPVSDVDYVVNIATNEESVPQVDTTAKNGNIPVNEEPEERRAGIQAPIVKVDENSSSVKKHPKSQE